MINDQLTDQQKLLVETAASLILNASKLIGEVDRQLQSEGSTGPNIINHVEYELQNTSEFITFWLTEGVEI